MTAADIVVDLRPADSGKGKAKAFADVTIPLGADGMMKIQGFSVFQRDGEPMRVAPPARKGSSRYFETVSLIGKVRSVVDAAILAEFERKMQG